MVSQSLYIRQRACCQLTQTLRGSPIGRIPSALRCIHAASICKTRQDLRQIDVVRFAKFPRLVAGHRGCRVILPLARRFTGCGDMASMSINVAAAHMPDGGMLR